MIGDDLYASGTDSNPSTTSPPADDMLARYRETSARCSSEQFQAAATEAFCAMSPEQRSALSTLLIDAAARQHITLAWTLPPASDPGSLGQFVAGLRKQRGDLIERLLEDDARRDPSSVAGAVLAGLTAAATSRVGGRA